jgi:hypothetical protein
MRIVKFFGAVSTFAMLGGSIAFANAMPASPVAISQTSQPSALADASSIPGTTSERYNRRDLAAPRPQKLPPFANFGQWDEAASEN